MMEGQRPQHAVPFGQAQDTDEARRDRRETVALGGQDALGRARGARGVEQPGHFVQCEIVPGGHPRLGIHQLLVPQNTARGHVGPTPGLVRRLLGVRTRRRAPGPVLVVAFGHHHGQPGPRRQRSPPCQTGAVGDEHPCPAVLQQAGQLLLRAPGVHRHAHTARPGDGEQALDHLDTVAEQYSHSVTARQTEPSQVTGQPCGPPFQLPLGHTPEPVLETDLVPEATGVVPSSSGSGLTMSACVPTA